MQLQHASILVVDDSEDNRILLTRRLERRGHTVAIAEDGRQAMDLIRQKEFDLILLDIMMPVMNGYQVLEEIKDDVNLRYIPVIVISGLDDMDSIVKCIELGAEDYLLKPFNRTLLEARINASLEKKWLRDQEKVYLQQIEETNKKLEERVQEYEAELKMARRVQVSLLPSELPVLSGWEFAVRWFPAREIAGDYYDFIPDKDGHTLLVLGDVTDKGLPASLFMVFARNSVRSSTRAPTAVEAISRANRLICTESNRGLYITLVCARITPDDGEIIYVNAGHESPLLFRKKCTGLEELPITGMALGVDVGASFEQRSVYLETGDFLVFFTDGVIDALNDQGEPLEVNG
jgi:CheY-like chemotaxis protein